MLTPHIISQMWPRSHLLNGRTMYIHHLSHSDSLMNSASHWAILQCRVNINGFQHTFSLTHRLATDRDQEGHCAKPRPLEWLHCSWAEFPEPASAALTRAGLCSARCSRAAGQGLTTPGRTAVRSHSFPSLASGPGRGSPEDTSQSPLSFSAPERPGPAGGGLFSWHLMLGADEEWGPGKERGRGR